MNEYIKEVANNLDFDNNNLKKINNFYITKKEQEILDKYEINYNSCIDINNLIYLIEDYLNDSYDDLPDLEEVSLNISERKYYHNTNK